MPLSEVAENTYFAWKIRYRTLMFYLAALQFPRHYGKEDFVIFPVILLFILGVNLLDKKTRRKP